MVTSCHSRHSPAISPLPFSPFSVPTVWLGVRRGSVCTCVCVCVCASVYALPLFCNGTKPLSSSEYHMSWPCLASPKAEKRGGVEKYILQPFIKKIKRPHLLSFSISLPVFWGVWKASTLCKSEIPLLWKCTSSLPLFFKAAIIINNKPLISTEKSCIKCMCKNKSPPSSFFPLSTRLLSEDFQQ